MAERDIQPGPQELLRAALEKIVFFEWRVSELAAELTAAQSRCASAEMERARADDEARAAQERAKSARRQLAELEAERARLSALLSQPTRATIDSRALEQERDRAARMQLELDEARRELSLSRAERERWLQQMTDQARNGEEEPAALAQFISELRGEIIALRARQQQCDELLVKAGVALPPLENVPPLPPPAPRREPEPVQEEPNLAGRRAEVQKPAPLREEPDFTGRRAEGRRPAALEDARLMYAEGRLAAPALTTHFALPPDPKMGVAARALAEQCLRNLSSGDSSRREQAARHLAAVPLASAAPALASALGTERDAKARAQLAKALAACGGEGAADLIVQLQDAGEPPLVRLAALEALAAIPARSRAALDVAARDLVPAVRRRAAALAAAEAMDDLLARFAADADPSVRAAVEAARREAPAPVEVPPPPAPDPVRDVLQAVQAALFGLTDSELAEHLGVPQPQAAALAQELIASGRLGRRGKRLVLAAGGAR